MLLFLAFIFNVRLFTWIRNHGSLIGLLHPRRNLYIPMFMSQSFALLISDIP
nr:MAG TPA: hypothetical protein [Caudoviricetes sp.]DAW78822.1 MAG TPA: hypothetical protein [Caudoviricetes sp.]